MTEVNASQGSVFRSRINEFNLIHKLVLFKIKQSAVIVPVLPHALSIIVLDYIQRLVLIWGMIKNITDKELSNFFFKDAKSISTFIFTLKPGLSLVYTYQVFAAAAKRSDFSLSDDKRFVALSSENR